VHSDHRPRRANAARDATDSGPTAGRASLALDRPVNLPIDADEVELIASEGFPLWEPVEVMVRRNRRITLAYADLSQRLGDVIARAGPDDQRALDANWCTFATWSSKTIGSVIEQAPQVTVGDDEIVPLTGVLPGGLNELDGLPLPRRLREAMAGCLSSSARALAAGNRIVFLEVGLAVATFLHHFPKPEVVTSAAESDVADTELWEPCWQEIQAKLQRLVLLDPSWLLTPSPAPDDLRLGLHHYFKALRPEEQARRSQHVLAANLLLAAYEQRRVDGYVWAALTPFTERAMGQLIRDRTGRLGGVRRWPAGLFARWTTRRMVLHLRGEAVPLGRPILPPADPVDRWSDLATNAQVTLPVLQALITRYQLSSGSASNPGATNWTSFDQRMRAICSLFRLRQRQRSLFDPPFAMSEATSLLDGR
jgi:AcrR family transcriptional regulator